MPQEAYLIGNFPDLSGARGRNRTTDTRIFNRDGNKYLNEYSKLYERKFGVCKSVFLIF